MSQLMVERLIGRLVTDKALRHEFTWDPKGGLERLTARGWDLDRFEIDALQATEISVWHELAARMDLRLQR